MAIYQWMGWRNGYSYTYKRHDVHSEFTVFGLTLWFVLLRGILCVKQLKHSTDLSSHQTNNANDNCNHLKNTFRCWHTSFERTQNVHRFNYYLIFSIFAVDAARFHKYTTTMRIVSNKELDVCDCACVRARAMFCSFVFQVSVSQEGDRKREKK